MLHKRRVATGLVALVGLLVVLALAASAVAFGTARWLAIALEFLTVMTILDAHLVALAVPVVVLATAVSAGPSHAVAATEPMVTGALPIFHASAAGGIVVFSMAWPGWFATALLGLGVLATMVRHMAASPTSVGLWPGFWQEIGQMVLRLPRQWYAFGVMWCGALAVLFITEDWLDADKVAMWSLAFVAIWMVWRQVMEDIGGGRRPRSR